MSVHRITLKGGRPAWKVRFRQDGANRSRSFDRRADARAFEAELRRRRQLGALAVQQLTERHGPTLGEWVEQRWAVEHASTLAQSTRDRYASVLRGPHRSDARRRATRGGHRRPRYAPGRWS